MVKNWSELVYTNTTDTVLTFGSPLIFLGKKVNNHVLQKDMFAISLSDGVVEVLLLWVNAVQSNAMPTDLEKILH